MTSGSNCRHLNKPQTEEARRSIRPAYHGLPAKLQHCRQTLLYHAFSSCLHEFSFSLQVLSGFRKFKATARSSQSGDGKDSGLWRIQHKQVITQGDAPLKLKRRPPVLATTAYPLTGKSLLQLPDEPLV